MNLTDAVPASASPRAVVIIPARFASTRLPGKAVLPEIKEKTGKYLIEHVYDRVRQATSISRVIVATDHPKIKQVVEGFGGEAAMTSPECQSGTDRVAEVAANLDVDIVVNVQGDEPEVHPETVDAVVALLHEDEGAPMATLAHRIDDLHELADPNAVKVIVDINGNAIYFSRYPIPYIRESPAQLHVEDFPYLKHLGIYAYRKDFLLQYTRLKPSRLEQAEKLEQLRALENGYRIKVAETPHKSIGVDTPEDMKAFIEKFTEANNS
ncbi:MAG: 3-deoxy-manno-octulosonate cytidylyltransferase [Planctomycetes bacterium]|nr:3-deoxy-manno-octulosonate cytidylyltransferase [Planctomycetota bacterium]